MAKFSNDQAGIRPEYVGSKDLKVLRLEIRRIFNAQGKEPNEADYAYWYRVVNESSNGWDAYWAIDKMWPDAPAFLPMPPAPGLPPPPLPPPAPPIDPVDDEIAKLLDHCADMIDGLHTVAEALVTLTNKIGDLQATGVKLRW